MTTGYDFRPENGYVAEPNVTQDSVPPTTTVEFPCTVCGREAGPYSGRGRRPTKCAEHKRNGRASTAPGRSNAKSRELAERATDALLALNSMVGLGIGFVGLPETAAELVNSDHTDLFREQAINALYNDPNLCRQILRGGEVSGRVSLILAYGMLIVGIAPAAAVEWREVSAARADRKAARLAAMPA